jgi:cysteinyl-tRNA synthetase
MQANYRSILDFSGEALEASEKGHSKLMEAVRFLERVAPAKTSTFDVQKWRNNCYAAMNDDFNSPILISHLFEAVKVINQIKDQQASLTKEDLSVFKKTINTFVFDVLGLMNEDSQNNSEKITGVIDLLIKLRKEARENKDWALSDQIRDELIALGIQLKDGREGTTFSIH